MSTEHQKYSTENQAAAIAAYASQRNLTIVRTYADHGRSGLRLDGREALQRLIGDVKGGQADFKLILVYDVSRWGRFQDADESAYYEFMCKEAGIHVLYCAEQFENDGSLVSAILKNMKRVVAGEYSRELSTKVGEAQRRGALLGFWQGGPAAYGIRRQLIDEHGKSRGTLEYGQHKDFKTDRIILVPGPPNEIKVVRRIFNSFVVEKTSKTQIAAELNDSKILNARGRPWKINTIHNLLRNEAYVGQTIFGRRSSKLGEKHVFNPPETWVRSGNALKGVIDPALFAEAQKRIVERRQVPTDKDLLDRLSKLWKKKGTLTDKIITAAKGLPTAATYARRFGSLNDAYELIGFEPAPRYNHKGYG